jgi:hypothetical protein
MVIAAPISVALLHKEQNSALPVRDMALAAPICALVWLCQHCLPSTPRNAGSARRTTTPSKLLQWPNGASPVYDPYDDPLGSPNASDARWKLKITR